MQDFSKAFFLARCDLLVTCFSIDAASITILQQSQRRRPCHNSVRKLFGKFLTRPAAQILTNMAAGAVRLLSSVLLKLKAKRMLILKRYWSMKRMQSYHPHYLPSHSYLLQLFLLCQRMFPLLHSTGERHSNMMVRRSHWNYCYNSKNGRKCLFLRLPAFAERKPCWRFRFLPTRSSFGAGALLTYYYPR